VILGLKFWAGAALVALALWLTIGPLPMGYGSMSPMSLKVVVKPGHHPVYRSEHHARHEIAKALGVEDPSTIQLLGEGAQRGRRIPRYRRYHVIVADHTGPDYLETKAHFTTHGITFKDVNDLLQPGEIE
jgi:hypothetical protein